MTVETATHLFSFVCGQHRCFVVDGMPLPLCQRCLGLYVGAFLTAIWLFGFGLWRRGLPNWNVLLVHTAALLAAMLGGIHVIDPGPLWRLTCGLWTGHVVMFWLVGAATQLWHLAHSTAPAPLDWRRRDTLQCLILPALLPALALAFPALSKMGWYLWTNVAALGAGVLGVATLMGVVLAAYYLVSFRRIFPDTHTTARRHQQRGNWGSHSNY